MRNLLLLALTALLTLRAQAQSADPGGSLFQDQSLGRSESTDASGLYLGKPGISVPIETITEGSFSLPIGLSYDAGGFKVAQQATNY